MGRDLPWRRTTDPYAIWVSEIMLQQTRVETVVGYYQRFLKAFPDVRSLARAPEDRVLGQWSGLGYYRRARLLHQGAKAVVASHSGQVPRDAAARLALPGIGRYTAGAIGSIAFGLREPIVDGNVARVLSRLYRIESPLGRADTERALWERAAQWADDSDPGAINQGLMELGATVCTPKKPDCGSCPLRAMCRGRGVAETLPTPRARVKKKRVQLAAVVATVGDEVWLVRRTEALHGGLHGGLWSLPRVETEPGNARAACQRVLKEVGLLGARVAKKPAGQLRHVLTHRALEVRIFRATHARASSAHPAAGLRSADLAGLRGRTFGMSRLDEKILQVVGLVPQASA